MRRGTAFPTILHMCPAKTQISMCISTVWSVLDGRIRWFESLAIDRMHGEDSDLTAQAHGSDPANFMSL